jgi:3-oxoadipate enol-lactonase
MAERPDTIDAGGVTLAYDRAGAGDTAVVFVHGLGGSRAGWSEQLRAAAEAGFQAVALDMRGAGDSERPPGPYSVEGWAADVTAAVGALELERAILVGHSVGCMVAEHAALALGEDCEGLAMLGGRLHWAEGFSEALAECAELARQGRLEEVARAVAIAALSERARRERPRLEDEFVRDFLAANDPDGYAESALATARGAMRTPEQVACPALAFAAAEDPVTPPESAREIAATMPRGRLATVPEGAHWCQVEAPEAVNDALLPFLRSVVTG